MASCFFEATNADNHGILAAHSTQTTMLCHYNTHQQAPLSPGSQPEQPNWAPHGRPHHKNCKDTSYNNIDTDRPNDNDNEINCFPRQDKQPVLQQQDVLPTAPTTTDTSPSLIESPTDKSTNTDNTNNNNKNNNEHTTDDCDDNASDDDTYSNYVYDSLDEYDNYAYGDNDAYTCW